MLPILYAVFPKEVPRYIDVFGGSSSVLLGKPKSKFEVFNDVDGELVNLFHCMDPEFETRKNEFWKQMHAKYFDLGEDTE